MKIDTLKIKVTLAIALGAASLAPMPSAFAGTVVSGGDEGDAVEFECRSPANVDADVHISARRSDLGDSGYVTFGIGGLQRWVLPARRQVSSGSSLGRVTVSYISTAIGGALPDFELRVDLPELSQGRVALYPHSVFPARFEISAGSPLGPLSEVLECRWPI